MKKLFFGGIHPAEKKKLTCDKGLLFFPEPDYVTIPLSQHIGAACQPLVKTGDYVYKGQKIGDGEGLCVPVHASVSGTVTGIRLMPHTSGSKVMAVVIKNDYKNNWDKTIVVKQETKASSVKRNDGDIADKNALVNEEDKPEKLATQELFHIIREAGIIGMGGAAFPTGQKAISAMEKVDTLLVNACECEPYITADDRLMQEWPERVIGGIKLLAQALKPQRVVLAVEDNKEEAIRIIRNYIKKEQTQNGQGGTLDALDGEYVQKPSKAFLDTIEMMILPTRYPQGAEKQLIQAVTGREVPPGKLPVDIGCVVFNVSTVAAVYQAVHEGRPLIERIVTVTGEGVHSPGNYLVPIGTSFGDLIEAAGGLKENADRVIAGGPMMGKAQETLDVPVIKGVGSVLCLLEEKVLDNRVCIRCGKCIGVCPVNLQPLYLYRYGKAGNVKMLDQYHLLDCIECGCCTYTCPGKLPLTEQFCADKKILREGKKK